jgi:HK97 family phage major capsid protein
MDYELKSLLGGISEKQDRVVTKVMSLEKKVDSLDSDVQKIKSMPAGHGFPFPDNRRSSKESEYNIGKTAQLLFRLSQGDFEAKEEMDRLGIKKAMTEGSGPGGGYAVPIFNRPEIIDAFRRDALLKYCKLIPMESNETRVPRCDAEPTVYWVGESGTITESSATLGLVDLKTKKLTGLVTISNELLMDMTPSVTEWIDERFRNALQRELDNQILSGTGDPCSGILSAGAGSSLVMATGSTTFDKATLTQLSQMKSLLPSAYLDGTIFILHRTVNFYLESQKDNQGMFVNDPSAKGPGTYWGVPYVLNDQAPSMSASGANKAFIALANLQEAGFIIGYRTEIEMAINPYSRFNTDETQIRWVWRIAPMIGLPSLLVRLLTSAS